MTDIENGEKKFGREQAWQLLTEWTQSESLRKHAIAVEIC
jgi:predicted hydrolase (HD superfamily)